VRSRFPKGLIIPEVADAALLGSGRCERTTDSDHVCGLGRLLDAFLFLLAARQRRGDGPLCRSVFTGPITGKPEAGYRIPAPYRATMRGGGLAQVKPWHGFMFWDIGIGVAATCSPATHLSARLRTCYFPRGLLPRDTRSPWCKAVLRSELGWWVSRLFLIVAAAFLSDTWLATRATRPAAPMRYCRYGFISRQHRIPYRKW